MSVMNEGIYRDSKIVEVLVAQAKGERLDSNVIEDANKVYAELTNEINNPVAKAMLANLITYAVEMMLPAETDWRRYVADERSIGDADEAAFRVKHDGIKAFIIADGSTTPRTRVAHSQIVLPTVTVSARPVVSLLELRSGKANMGELAADATRKMANVENQYIENVLLTAAATWQTPFYGTGAGVIAATIDPMIQHWMRSGSAAIVGDIAAVQKLAPLTGFTASATTQQFSPEIINEFNNTGRIGTYKGASVVQFVNPYETDGVTTVMKRRALYIIPTAANAEDRPLKVVRKGNIMNVDHTDIDEMTYEIRMDERFGAGIAIGDHPMMSVYVDSTL